MHIQTHILNTAATGPALGPIIGGAITQTIGWPWLFWVMSIFDGCLLLSSLFLFPETSAPMILAKKAKNLRKIGSGNYTTEYERLHPSISRHICTALSRPFRFLVTHPIIQLLSFLLAYNFGLIYIVLSTFANVWIDRYNESISTSGLNYISIIVGYTLGSQVGAPMSDRVWAYFRKRYNGDTVPEYRIPLMIPGAILLPTGLLWYGWSVEARLHWIMPNIGAALYGCGVILSSQAMQAYLLDAYKTYTASALAAAQLPRGIAAFVFPIFSPAMYHVLGYGWGNTLLACTFLTIGVPAPVLLWKYGARLRLKGNQEP